MIRFLLLLSLSMPLLAVELPERVQTALKHAKIPAENVAVVVREAHHAGVLINHHGEQPMNPASTMKLLTTLAGLELLGPDYRWKTEAYIDGTLSDGVLHGNLWIKGYGNPKFTLEDLWLWLREMRARGLRDIQGDLLLDQSYFADLPEDPGEFDNDPTRPYNVTPKALLLNFNAVRLNLVPNGERVNAWLEPPLHGYLLDNQLKVNEKLSCGHLYDYQFRLQGRQVTLNGTLPTRCGEVVRYAALLSHNEYFNAVFRRLWQDLGGTLSGQMRTATVGSGTTLFASHASRPLVDSIYDINKFSNNIMARQLFLSLSDAVPATPESSSMAIQTWLALHDYNFPELVLENGSGLSRRERISALHLADVLELATRSPFAAELEASLPIPGLDGTLKKRFLERDVPRRTHLKTGSLNGVKSIAGYVGDPQQRQWIVVFIVNHPRAAFAKAAQEELINWLEQGMPQ